MTATWHADGGLLDAYADGSVDHARAASVEAHLLACPECRRRVGKRVDAARTEALWTEIVDDVDRPRVRPIERVLRGLGVPAHTARVLVATRSIQLSWLVGVAVVLAFAVVADSAGRGSVLPFLIVAPILPVVGVAAAFGPVVDPTYEVTMASPLAATRLLLLRSVAVLGTTAVLAGAAALALPGLEWTAAAWVLPALGLTTGTLALATVTTSERAATAITTAWLATVLATVGGLDDALAAFRPAGQVTFAVVTAVSLLVVRGRRDMLEVRSEQ
jgi:predicted outer membrane lipoprotein